MDDMDTGSEGMRDLGEEEVLVSSPPPYIPAPSFPSSTPLSPTAVMMVCESNGGGGPTPSDLLLLDNPCKEPSPKYLENK
jgi:hypothetical protein